MYPQISVNGAGGVERGLEMKMKMKRAEVKDTSAFPCNSLQCSKMEKTFL